MSLIFFVRSDLIECGTTEDGDAIIRFAWYVVAENEDTGERWAHFHRKVTRCDVRETPAVFAPLLERMRRDAPRFQDRGLWARTYPRYLSPSYDGAAEAAAEKRAEGF